MYHWLFNTFADKVGKEVMENTMGNLAILKNKKENGRRVVEFCAERELCVGNIF